MISKIQNVQLVCKALVDYEIDQFVISPGGSSMAIVHTIENMLPEATIHSVVDERSASYFALGLWQQSNKPVALICTSGTAVANYLPGIIESHYQNAKIIIITADKDTNYNHQRKTQIIDQTQIFKDFTKLSVTLHANCIDSNYSENKRRITSVFKEILNEKSSGPVHINVPVIGPLLDFSVENLDDLKFPKFYNSKDDLIGLNKEISSGSAVLVVIGQSVRISAELKDELNKFQKRFNAFIYTESTSNYWPGYERSSYPKVEIDPDWCAKNLAPDILITFGGNLVTYQMHTFIEKISKSIEHWSIQYDNHISDNFGKATKIIDFKPYQLFKSLNINEINTQQQSYKELWNKNAIVIDENTDELTNITAIKTFCNRVPENSIVHTSILNSTRWLQFFQNKPLRGFSNIGALGIDGSLSTFIGHASGTKDLAYFITGELSFLYDMNSLSLAKKFSNLRILLINNGGGGEFHLSAGKKNIPTLDVNISIKENRAFGTWPEENRFDHKIVTKIGEIDDHFNWFFDKHDSNKLLEIRTDMEHEGNLMRNIFEENRSTDALQKTKSVLKKILRKN